MNAHSDARNNVQEKKNMEKDYITICITSGPISQLQQHSFPTVLTGHC